VHWYIWRRTAIDCIFLRRPGLRPLANAPWRFVACASGDQKKVVIREIANSPPISLKCRSAIDSFPSCVLDSAESFISD
jgi:hypothetical protein